MFVSDRYGSESSPGWGAEGSNRRIPPWTVSSWRARRAGLPGWWGGGWRRPAGGRGRGRRRRGGTAPAGPTRRSPPSAWPGATCPCTRTRCLVWKKIQINSNLWNLGTLASDFFVSVLAMMPGMAMSYDVTPLAVHHDEGRENILVFLSSLVSIVGGAFVTVSNMTVVKELWALIKPLNFKGSP